MAGESHYCHQAKKVQLQTKIEFFSLELKSDNKHVV